MGRAKELTKNTMIITVGRISTQFVSFLLLPLYTSILTPGEYGTVDLVVTLVNLLIPVVSVMTDQGAFRFLLNCETDRDKRRVISSAFFLLLMAVAATSLVYVVISPFVHTEFKLWLILILAATAFSNLFLQIARGLHKTADYAIGSFICSSVTIVLNVLCIAFLRMGAVGMLVATLTGNVICSLALFIKLGIARYVSLASFEKDTAKELLRYSSPLVPHQLSLWVMNSSDRLIVAFFLGTAANGILAISHKFPTIFMTFYSIFQLAWHETGAVHFFDEDRDEFFSSLINRIILIFSSLCLCVIGVLPICFDWLIKSDFAEAYYNIPIYMAASLCNVVVGLLGVVYVATKKTGEIAKTTMIAAAINIMVNLALIKVIGLYAASLSTLAGYLVTMIYRIKDTKKYLKIRYDVRQAAGICAALAACCGVYYMNNRIVSLIFFPLLVTAVYTLNRDLIQTVLSEAEKKTGIAKKTISICVVAGIAAVIIAGGIIAADRISSEGKDLTSEYGETAVSAEAKKTVMFSDFGEKNFTCTGLAYDEKDPGFWIADYGALSPDSDTSPRIIKVDRSLTGVKKTIPLKDVLPENANVQGLACDNASGTLWAASDGTVTEISRNGEALRSFDIGRYSRHQANGICCDPDGTLWILCRTKYLLHYSREGQLIKAFSFRYKDQDHICTDGEWLYATVGADYQGDDNYIVRIDPKNGRISGVLRAEGSHAVEGITFDGQNFYIANDGKYHKDSVGQSYISVYDAASTEIRLYLNVKHNRENRLGYQGNT